MRLISDKMKNNEKHFPLYRYLKRDIYNYGKKEKSQHIVSDRYTVHFWRDTDRGAVDRRTVQIFYQICHGENGNLRVQHG